MSIEIRIFMGYLLNKEIQIHLNRSSKWKEAKLLRELSLIETYWQEKEYIGFFIPSLLTHDQIKEKEKQIRSQLQIYCPKINLDKHSIHFFSQLFLS